MIIRSFCLGFRMMLSSFATWCSITEADFTLLPASTAPSWAYIQWMKTSNQACINERLKLMSAWLCKPSISCPRLEATRLRVRNPQTVNWTHLFPHAVGCPNQQNDLWGISIRRVTSKCWMCQQRSPQGSERASIYSRNENCQKRAKHVTDKKRPQLTAHRRVGGTEFQHFSERQQD